MPSLLQPRTPGMNYGNRGSVANGYPKSFGSGLRARQPSPPLTEGPDDAPPSPSPTPFAVSKRLPLLNGNGSVPQPGLGGIEGPMDRDPTGRRIQVGPQTGRMGLQSRASNQISNNIDQMVKTHNQKLKSMWDQHDKYVNTMEGVGSQTDYQKDLGWQASQIANGDQVARGRGAQDLTGFGRGLVAAQAQGLPQQEPINARGNGDFVPQGGPVDPQRLAEAKALFAGKTSGQNFADAKRKQRESLDVPGTTNGFFNFGVGAREAREKYRDQNLIARSQLPGMNPNHPKVVEAKIREQRRLNAMQLPDREEELHSNRLQQLHDAHADVILKGAAKLAESGKEADITKAADMIQKHIANVELIRNPKKMATIDPNEFLPAKTGGQPIPRSQLKAATQPPRPGVTEPDGRGQGSSTKSGAVGDTPMKRASLLLGPLLDLIAPKIERSDPAAFLKKKVNDAGLDVNDRKVGQPLANARALAADRLGIQLGVPDPKFAHMSPKAQLLLSNRLGVATSNNPWEQNIPDEHIQTEYDRHIRDIQSARKNLLDGGIPVEEVDTMFPVPKFEEFRFRHSNAFGRKANIAPKK